MSTEPNAIPRDPGFDSTFALLKEGYCFLGNRHRRFQSDIFEMRLMLQKTISITGREAAVLFYNPTYFKRHGAAPNRVRKTLFGDNGIQTLDGKRHRRRKAMFMSFMTPGQIDNFLDLLRAEWEKNIVAWYRKGDTVNLFAEAREMLCRAACAWAGVPLAEQEACFRAADMYKMVDAFGAIGPRHWQGRAARKRSERWAQKIIRDIRREKIYPGPNAASSVIARYTEPDGALLSLDAAAVELLNIIRPVVAIARYILFIAVALEKYPVYRNKLRDDDRQAENFVQEVRRYFPFTPFLGALTRTEFDWRGYRIPANTRVVLDVYGINHDPRIWRHPNEFSPDRFSGWQPNAYSFIPQGGGDFLNGHRCAGEWITIESMKLSALFLATFMNRDMFAHELTLDLATMPTAPESGFPLHFI